MLQAFFEPRGVAIVGASRDERKLGHGVLKNLIQHGYPGSVYPVNPSSEEILGLKSYPNVLEIPDPVDLAVIVVPSRFVQQVVEQCGQRGIEGAVIITAGFREAGHDGVRMEREIVETAKRYGIRLVGPNCLGIIDTVLPMNCSFAVGMPEKGHIAFMSQSGALCTSILDWALAEGIGFSRFVSLGNKADVDEVDLLGAWAQDEHSRVIVSYVEGLRDGREFIEVARQVTRKTPFITVKSGRTAAGSRAVSSHTGSLAGADAAYDAAFRQSGVLRVDSIQDLFDASLIFAYQPVMKGNRIAIVTNAGGPGIMATDALEGSGMQLAAFQRETVDYLREHLPPAASIYNPVDVIGDARSDRYAVGLEAALKDENVHGVIVILTPQVMTEIAETAHLIGRLSAGSDKPVVGCFMGKLKVEPGIQILAQYKVPNYLFPERAVAALHAMWSYREWLNTPPAEYEMFDVDREKVRAILRQVRDDERLTVGESEARGIIEAYGIQIPESKLARSPEEAVQFADEIGYPVVMKIASPDILHKSDIGGIKLGVSNADEVRDAFDLLIYRATRYMADAYIWGVQVQEMVQGGKEIIIGMNHDPQFGPLLMFGLGGIYVEVLKDVTFRVAPISRREAEEMITEIRSYHLLQGVRGERASDRDAIVDVLLRVSQLVTDFPEIVEMDINPLLVCEVGRGAVAVDMRLVLSGDERAH